MDITQDWEPAVPIPNYQTAMLPLLRLAADGQEHSIRDATNALSVEFNLTPEERNELLPSGRTPRIKSRVGWARTYLRKAGLLEIPRRGFFRITERGRGVLNEKPTRIDCAYLERFPEFLAFKNLRHEKPDKADSPVAESTDTPEEVMETAFQQLRENLASDLLEEVKKAPPSFFETLVVELLVEMGYGGSLRDAGRAVGQSGDGGIDGIIKEDRLGLDAIYVQAKRWEGTVGRPEIQKFAGALQGQRARKGVFITTSSFTKEARDYVEHLEVKIILLDGSDVSRLMIECGVGVSTEQIYEVKRIDHDYFTEDDE